MESRVKEIATTVEPIADGIYGPRYRCALTLKDGTWLPCAVFNRSNAWSISRSDASRRRWEAEASPPVTVRFFVSGHSSRARSTACETSSRDCVRSHRARPVCSRTSEPA